MTWGKTESSNGSGYEPGVSFPAPGQITQEKLGTQILRQKDCEFENSQLYIVKLPQNQNRYLRSQLISVHDVRNFSPDGLISFVMVGMTPKEGIGKQGCLLHGDLEARKEWMCLCPSRIHLSDLSFFSSALPIKGKSNTQ